MTNPRTVQAVRVGETLYEKLPDGTLKPLKGETDWERVEEMPDEEIESAALSDPDNPPLTDEEWANIKPTDPFKSPLTIRLDTDVVDWFKNQGSQYQTKINAVLRQYVKAHRKAG